MCASMCVCVCLWVRERLVSTEECSLCGLGPWGGRGLLFGLQFALGVEEFKETVLLQPGSRLLTLCGGVNTRANALTHMYTADMFTRQQVSLCTPLASTSRRRRRRYCCCCCCGRIAFNEWERMKKRRYWYKKMKQRTDFCYLKLVLAAADQQ